MAVEVSFELDVLGGKGFLLPISAAIPEGEIPETSGPTDPSPVSVYIYDPSDSTVHKKEVTMAGLQENKFVIVDGLNEGDRVAIAGVSFLHEGMKVKLLEPEE